MAQVLWSPGWNIALASLFAPDPLPESGMVMPVQRTYGASGIPHEMGLYGELKWGLIETEADYLANLTAIGLHNALSNQITVYLRNFALQWNRYNGIAIRPEAGRDVQWRYFAVNTTMRVIKLEQL